METMPLGRRALVEECYRSIEATRQRHDRVALKERAGDTDGGADDDSHDGLRGSCDLESDGDQSLDILAEVAAAVRAHCIRRPATYSYKKQVVLGSIMRSLYSGIDSQSPCRHLSDKAGCSSRTTTDKASCAKKIGLETDPTSLNDLDTPTQFALRMFFRMCRSLADPERLVGSSRLAVQIAHQLPSILLTVPPCVLAPGFSDSPSLSKADNALSVFNELFGLFSKLLELPVGRASSSRGSRQLDSGVTLSAVSTSEHGCLSCSDHWTVVIAYLALALKMGRLGHLLTALQYLLECEPDTVTIAQLEQLHPLFEELASARAELVHEAPDQEETVAGFVMSFGKGDHGKLGHGQCSHTGCQDGNCTENKLSPTIIEATRDVKFAKIDSLSTHSIGITTTGEIMAWGNGDKYRLGHGSTAKEYVPRAIDALTVKGRVRDIACGLGHTLALMDSGEIYAWGNGSNGRLGLGDALDRSNPTLVPPASIVTARISTGSRGDSTGGPRLRNVYCGASHSMAISWDGRLFCWGKNNQGQCGHGHANDQLFVQEVAFFAEDMEDTVVNAAGGWEHSLFCSSSGRVFASGCGYKDSRRTGVPPVLGLGDFDRRLKPAVVVALTDAKEEIVKVSCGWDHSIAISATGQVFTWGSGANGKLGHGDEESCDLPTLVKDMDGKVVVDAKAGCEHTVLLTSSHEVWTFGHGDSGRLGHGDSLTRKTPTRIEQFAQSKMKPVAIAAGDKYNLVLVAECEAEELSSHEPVDRRLSSMRNKSRGHRVDTTLSELFDFGHDGTHGVSSTTAHPARTFQSDWVLSLLQLSSGEKEDTGSPRVQPQVFPTSIRSAVLFILGHIDRIAIEYRRSGYGEERDDPVSSQSSEIVLPFALDTSTGAVRALLELLTWSVSALHDLESPQEATSSASGKQFPALFSRDMTAQDRAAVVLSLLRILQLNISRMTALKLQSSVDEVRTSSDDDELVRIIFDLLSRTARLDDDKLARLLCEGDENQVSGRSHCALAVRYEATMVLKAGFGLFYPDSQAHSNLLHEILRTSKDDTDRSSAWTAVLANCLYKDKTMKPLFHELISPNAVHDLQSTLLSLLELCLEQRGSGVDWPSRMLQAVLLHWLGLISQLLDIPQFGASNTSDSVFKLLPDLLKRMMAHATKHIQAKDQEEDPTGLDRSPVCSLLLSVVECLCSMLRRSTNNRSVARVFRLLIIERMLPKLRSSLPVLEKLVSTMNHRDDHVGRGAVSQHQDGSSSASQCIAELSGSCCGLYGVLCAEALSINRDVDSMNESEIATIKRALEQLERSRVSSKHGDGDGRAGDQQTTDAPLSACIRQGLDENHNERTLFSTALIEATTTLQVLTTDPAKRAFLSEITGALLAESTRHHDRDLQVNGESVSGLYLTVATLLNELSHTSSLVQEALALWCVPLTSFGLSSEEAADTIVEAGVVASLKQILLHHQDVMPLRHEPPHTIATNLQHEAVWSPSHDVSRGDLLSALPPKLKHALLPLFTDTWSFEGAGTLAWEALCAVALQLAKPNRGSTVNHSIEQVLETLFALLQLNFEAQKQLRASSSQLAALVIETVPMPLNPQANTLRWREQSRVFLLANPVVASAVKHQTVGLSRSVVSSRAAIDTDSSVEAQDHGPDRLSLSLWLYANAPHRQVSTTTNPLSTQPSIVDDLQLPPDSICLMAVGGASIQVSGGISRLLDAKTSTVVLTAAPGTDGIFSLSLITASARTPGGDVVYECTKLGDDVPVATWCHLALVLSRTEGNTLQVFINGSAVGVPSTSSPQFDDDFFDEAFNWSSVHIGGQMNDSSLTQAAATEGGQRDTSVPATEFSVVLDDVWMIGREIATEAIHQLYLGGPVLFQAKRQSRFEDRCFDVVRLLHAMMTTANTDSTSTLCSDRWILLLIRLHSSCMRLNNSATVVYLTEVLSQLLPLAPASSTIDLLDLGHACFPRFLLDRSDHNDVMSVHALVHLCDDSSRPQHDDIPFSKRRELLQALSYRRSLNGVGSATFDKKSGKDRGESPDSNERGLTVAYAAGLRLFHNLVASPRWTSWMEQLVDLLVADETLVASASKSTRTRSLLHLVVSILSGYPAPLFTGCVRGSAESPALQPTQILRRWSDAILSPSTKQSRLSDSVVPAIQKLFVLFLGSTEWQPPQLQQLDNAVMSTMESQFAERAGLIATTNLRTRMLRVVASQLTAEQLTGSDWSALLLQNPSICRFLLQTASTPVATAVKSVFGSEPVPDVVHSFMACLQDSCRLYGHFSQLQLDLEELQWRAWSALHSDKQSLQAKLLALSPSLSPKPASPLASVDGKVDICGLKVFAREGFPTVKLPTSTICANSGLWFYEVVLLTSGLMQIGFLDEDFTADPTQGQGVGDHASSWAFDGYRCKKWNVSSQEYGERWHVHDVVGVLLDTDRMEISFFLNGKYLGVAFGASAVATNSSIDPAASLNVCQAVEFVVGPSNDAVASVKTSDERQQLCQDAFRFWPTLESQQDQRRLKPVSAAMTTASTLPHTGRYGASTLDDARLAGIDDGDSVEDDSDIDHDYGALRTTTSYLGGDEADTMTEYAVTERRHLAASRDDQDRRTAESSIDTTTVNADKEEESNRRRELVDGLTSLGIPFEWALRCALETGYCISESGSVTWVLEQMEKQAALVGSRLRPTNADGGLMGSAEIRWPSQVSVRAVGASHSAGHLAGLGSSRSIISVDGGDKSQRENAIDGQDNRHRYNVVPPSLLAVPAAVETRIATAPVIVDVSEAPADLPNEHFTTAMLRQGQDGPFDSVLPHMQCAVQETPPAQRPEVVISSLPLCIAADSVLCVKYSRLALASLFNATGDASAEMYRLVVEWIGEEPTRIALTNYFRIAIGLYQGEPRLEGGGSLAACNVSHSRQLEQTLLAMLDEELQQQTSDSSTEGLSEVPARDFPLFRLLFDSIRLVCQRADSTIEAFSSTQRCSTDLESLTLDAAWFAWLGGIIYSHIERVVSRDIKPTSANIGRFAQVTSSTCYSLVFFKQLAEIALRPAPDTLMQWKLVAIKLMARISSRLKNTRTASPSSSDAESRQLAWFSDIHDEYRGSLPVQSLVELLTVRMRRESASRVYASEMSSAVLELLSHLARPLPQRREDIVSDEAPTYEMYVDNVSSASISLSWRHKQRSISSNTATDGDGDGCDHDGANIVALHIEEIPSRFSMTSFTDKETEGSPRVFPCQGTATLRNLAPDTTYRVWLTQLNADGSVSTPQNNAEVPGSINTTATTVELEVQTIAEPPFELDSTDAGKNLVVLNQNLTVKNAINKKWHSVRGTAGFDEGVHDWQVRIDVCVSKNIFIGVCTAEASLENYIGSDAFGYGFLANKAVWNNKTKLHSYGDIFKQGDLLRVTLDCNARTLAFSLNGESLGIAATNLRPGGDRGVSGADTTMCKWYPAFSLYNKDDQLTLIPPVTSVGSSVAGSQLMVSQYASVDVNIAAMNRTVSYMREVGVRSQSTTSSDCEAVEDAYRFFSKWRMRSLIVREIGLGRLIVIDSSRQATDKYGLYAGDTVFTSQGQCVVLGESQHLLWYEVDSISKFETRDRSQDDRKAEVVAAWSRSCCLEMMKNADDFPVHRHSNDNVDGQSNSANFGVSVTAEQFRACQSVWTRSKEAVTWDSLLVSALDSLALARRSPSPLHVSCDIIETALLADLIPLETFQAHFDTCCQQFGGDHRPVSCLLMRIAFLATLNASIYRAARFVMPRNHFARLLPVVPTSEEGSATAITLQPEQQGVMAMVTLASTLSSPLWTTCAGLLPSQTAREAVARMLFRGQKERLMSEDMERSKTTTPVVPVPTSTDALDAANPAPTTADLPVVSVSYPARARAVCFWHLPRSTSRPTAYPKRWLLPKSSHSMATLFAQLSKQLASRDAVDWRREVTRAFDALPVRQTFVVSVSSLLEASRYTAGMGVDQAGGGDSGTEADEAASSIETDLSVEYLRLLECAANEIQSPDFPLLSPVSMTEDQPADIILDINTSLFLPVVVCSQCCYYPTRSELLGRYFHAGQLLGIAWRSRALLPLQFLSKAFWNELVDPACSTESENSDCNDDESKFRARARQEAIDSVRDGLLSIVPSRSLTLCASGAELRERLSDLDVQFIDALHSRSVYDTDNRHHRLFWRVVKEFSAVERQLLAKFIAAGRTASRKVDGDGELVLLELVDALDDGRDRPDACYPVMTVVDSRTRRLHLPEYSSATALRAKLTLAMTNLQLE